MDFAVVRRGVQQAPTTENRADSRACSTNFKIKPRMKSLRKFQYAIVAMAAVLISACTADPFPSAIFTPDRTTNIQDGYVITYTVVDPLSIAQYEWGIVSGGQPFGSPSPFSGSFQVVARGNETAATDLVVRCRAVLKGKYSNWSESVLSIQPGPTGPIVVFSNPLQDS